MKNKSQTIESMIIDDSFIIWLERILNVEESIDDIYFARHAGDQNRFYLYKFESLIRLMCECSIKLDRKYMNLYNWYLSYNGKYYHFEYDGECNYCRSTLMMEDDYNNDYILPYDVLKSFCIEKLHKSVEPSSKTLVKKQ